MYTHLQHPCCLRSHHRTLARRQPHHQTPRSKPPHGRYSFTFHSFARGPIHPKIFSVPSICNDTADDDASANTDSQNAEEAAAAALVLPGALPDAGAWRCDTPLKGCP
jgi:hypothetical protein